MSSVAFLLAELGYVLSPPSLSLAPAPLSIPGNSPVLVSVPEEWDKCVLRNRFGSAWNATWKKLEISIERHLLT